MLERIPTPYSVNAADAADRLRLIGTDLHLVELATIAAIAGEEDREAILMHVRRLVSDVELLKDDILERDKKGGVS